MKVLFVSNLFPDPAEPMRGIHNARLVHHLSRHCEIRVISPRPTLPFRGRRSLSARPEDDRFHPVFPLARYIPKIGSAVNHHLLAASVRTAAEAVRPVFAFDICLVSWAYPDAVAVATLAREWNVPFIAVAQGSDVYQGIRMSARRRSIIQAFNHATAVIARSRDLARLLTEAGVRDEPHVVYNGVDSSVFQPRAKHLARREVKLPEDDRVILFVGNLVPIKNPALLLRAAARWGLASSATKWQVVVAGDGPLRRELERLARESGIATRVRFVGRQPEDRVARYMQSADVLCVPSNNEGVPNVLLEAFACGLPAVATRVGGIPEVLDKPSLGVLVERNNATQVAYALDKVLRDHTDRESIVAHSSAFSWDATAASYFRLVEQATSETGTVVSTPNL